MNSISSESLATDLIDNADTGLLVTLANAHYVEHICEILFDVVIPNAEQERFGMELVYEEFMLRASCDLIPKFLATQKGVKHVRRLARERLSGMIYSQAYETAIEWTLRQPDPSGSRRNQTDPLIWFRIGDAVGRLSSQKVCID